MSRPIVVHKRQDGNQVVKHITRAFVWDETIKADFATGNAGILFLSLKYHKVVPDNIYNRIGEMGRDSFPLRVMLVKVDIDNYTDSLKELTRACFIKNFTLVLCWSDKEAAEYIMQLKSNDKTTGDQIKGAKKKSYQEQLQEVLTTIRGVNKTDTVALAAEFGSFREILRKSKPENLESIRGLGARKVYAISETLNGQLGNEDVVASQVSN